MGTAEFFDNVYEAAGIGSNDERSATLFAKARAFLKKYDVGPNAVVLEVGAGHGELRHVHPNWHGLEFSQVAIQQGNVRLGGSERLTQGDATRLAWADASVDALFSFSTFEHIPEIEKAIQEIMRVLRPGAAALLAPSWNCRPWTVRKLQQRPYAELGLREKVGKALIPLRENLLFRLLLALPGRLKREALLLRGRPLRLDYRALAPQWDLLTRYPRISDDDAFVSIDAHAAMTYVVSRGFAVPSHPSALKRLLCRGEPIVIVKPFRI
jgi:SAM-dependent methyltransferase